MYSVAQVDWRICSKTGCRLCTQYCPEPNTIHYAEKYKAAFIAVDRCKGCEICVEICASLAKRHAIKMVPVADIVDGFEMSKYGFPRE